MRKETSPLSPIIPLSRKMRNGIYSLILFIWVAGLFFFTWPKEAVNVFGTVALILLSMAAGISLYRLLKRE